MASAAHLRVVRDVSEPARRARAPRKRPVPRDRGDVALLVALFVVNAVPVTCELAGIGQWSPAIVGFAAGALLLVGRALWSELGARRVRATP